MDPAHARRYAWATGLVVAALALALAVMIAGPHRVGDYFAETDFYGAYADGARALQRGVVDPTRYGVVGPGYETALAVAGFVVRDLFTAAELLSLVSIATALWLWSRLLARRADPRLALLTTLFLAVNPTVFRYGYSVTNDALALALGTAALYVLLSRRGLGAALLAGALVALAFLTRYSAVALLPAGLVSLLAGGTVQERSGRAALAFAASFAAPVGAWTLFSITHGATFSFQFHHNIAYDVFARSRGIPWDDYQKLLQPRFHSLADVIARDPGAVARRELFNLWDHLRLDARQVVGMPAATAAAFGSVLAWRDGTLTRLWPVCLTAALSFLALVPVFHSDRYSLVLLPAWLTLAAAAFSSSRFACVVGAHRRVWLKPLLAVVPLTLATFTTARATARLADQLPREVLACARTLRSLARPGDRVLARKAHIGFHAGLPTVAFPFADSLPPLAAYARENRTRWLFFSWPEAELRPAFWYLLDTSAVVPGLTVRHSTPRPAVLYEIGPQFGTVPSWMRDPDSTLWHQARARLRVNPADQLALLTAGFVEYRWGRLDSARERLERCLSLEPRNADAWLLLGNVHLAGGDGLRASASFTRASSLDPRRAEARQGQGWASLVMGRPRDAAAWWRPVVSLTRDQKTLERMAELYKSLGDPVAEAEARAALARARRRS